jgi:hypothetical protein
VRGSEQAPERRRRPGQRLARAFISADSYGLVLLLIVLTYVLSVSVTERWGASLVLAVQILTVWLVFRTSKAPRWARLSALVLLAFAAVTAVARLFVSEDQGMPAVFLASTVLYFIAPFSIVGHIGVRRDVDQETVLGAIAAYLLIGMFFAFAYRSIAAIQAGPFFGAGGDGSISDTLFFSFVTISTTGYGNLVPAANPGQSLAVLEAVAGQLFLVTAVAKVISAWRPKRLGAEDESPEGSEPTVGG